MKNVWVMTERNICYGSPTFWNRRKMQIEVGQFLNVSLVILIESSYWSASFRLLSSLWWDMLEERRSRRRRNSKKVLNATNVSRATKSRPVWCIVRRFATPRPGISLQVSWIFSVWCYIHWNTSREKMPRISQLNWQHFQALLHANTDKISC